VAAALTPFTICFDAAIIASVVVLVACAKGGSGFNIPSGGGGAASVPDPYAIQRGLSRFQLAELESGVSLRALRRLGSFGFHAKAAVPALKRLLASEDEEIALESAILLAVLCPWDPDFSMPTLAALLASPNVETRRTAAKSLGARKVHASIPVLVRALSDYDEEVRCHAARSLGTMGRRALPAVPALRRALHDGSRRVRAAAEKALWSIPGE
jgi:HEAT repeat protein